MDQQSDLKKLRVEEESAQSSEFLVASQGKSERSLSKGGCESETKPHEIHVGDDAIEVSMTDLSDDSFESDTKS